MCYVIGVQFATVARGNLAFGHPRDLVQWLVHARHLSLVVDRLFEDPWRNMRAATPSPAPVLPRDES